jgi:hypothetical protein
VSGAAFKETALSTMDAKLNAKFELIGSDGLFSGLRHLRYGTGHDDPMPFTLTLTPRYVHGYASSIPTRFLETLAQLQNSNSLRAG